MVLEALINPVSAEKKPWNLFIIGFVYSLLAVFISYWIFPEYAGIVSITLIVITFVPLLYATMKTEEERDINVKEEIRLLEGHGKALTFFLFMFIGITAAITVAYLFVPTETASSIFQPQISTISRIQGNAVADHSSLSTLNKIFLNNVKVLGFCILFSFLYGAGAIFILAWNASIIGVAMGDFIRTELSKVAGVLGLVNVSSYFHAVGFSIIRYLIHGIPEIAAYFVGALAGGIISVAIINHEVGTKRFEKVIADASILILISVAMLIVASLLEVYMIPLIF